jgi:hypothetical protein
VDCGHRQADTALYDTALNDTALNDTALAGHGPPGVPRAGDCVAPRTAAEAVLEGRRRALEIGALEIGALDMGTLDITGPAGLEREQPPPARVAPGRQPAAP